MTKRYFLELDSSAHRANRNNVLGREVAVVYRNTHHPLPGNLRGHHRCMHREGTLLSSYSEINLDMMNSCSKLHQLLQGNPI